jgi:hypothetical protein
VGKNEDHIKLWAYVKKWMHTVCEKFESNHSEVNNTLVEGLKIVIAQYKSEDLSKKLTHEFLSLNESLINNVDLNVLLFKNSLISVSEWDNQIAMFLKENYASLADNVFQFFSDFLRVSV